MCNDGPDRFRARPLDAQTIVADIDDLATNDLHWLSAAAENAIGSRVSHHAVRNDARSVIDGEAVFRAVLKNTVVKHHSLRTVYDSNGRPMLKATATCTIENQVLKAKIAFGIYQISHPAIS